MVTFMRDRHASTFLASSLHLMTSTWDRCSTSLLALPGPMVEHLTMFEWALSFIGALPLLHGLFVHGMKASQSLVVGHQFQTTPCTMLRYMLDHDLLMVKRFRAGIPFFHLIGIGNRAFCTNPYVGKKGFSCSSLGRMGSMNNDATI
ncbi:hypothetical protein VNO77_20191 [Canavalia gladiata]|uniref:Uncharacterized protein n=1 Tax=Canavalia gladiata TaxID=3824 RepID=A0AAN9LSC5_CANGL